MPEIIIANHSTDALNRAIGKLRAGELVAIPTETVYGLAADATSGEAVAKIFATKQRPSFNPLICHVDGVVMAQQYGKFDMIAERLANTFWPGPLTLILPLVPESGIHDLVTAGLDSIGLRCPRGFSRQVISAFGRPLAAPSANRSGRISPTTAQHVAADFAGTELLILDAGACEAMANTYDCEDAFLIVVMAILAGGLAAILFGLGSAVLFSVRRMRNAEAVA